MRTYCHITRTGAVALLILICSLSVSAQFPGRSSLQMTVTPDHSNWEYRRGEQAKLQVELSDEGKPVKDAYVRFQLMEDKMPVFRTDSVRIVNGKGVI